MSHVFISYVRDDAEPVNRISVELKNRGIDVWLDRERIGPGERWKDAIRSAIAGGAYFLSCFSKNYVSKETSYMNEELTLAIDELRKRSHHRRWFIPLLLSECEVPARSIGGGETLLDFQWIDLYTDFAQGMNRIALELNADEVARRQRTIDDLGRVYVARDAEPGQWVLLVVNAKKRYIEAVDELRALYGITYDPFKICLHPSETSPSAASEDPPPTPSPPQFPTSSQQSQSLPSHPPSTPNPAPTPAAKISTPSHGHSKGTQPRKSARLRRKGDRCRPQKSEATLKP